MHGQWAKIVQPRTGWRHARQQPDFLLLFGTCGNSLSGTTAGGAAAEWIKTIVLSSPFSSTSNRRTALKRGTTDLRGPRNTLVQKILEVYLRQKSRFWSVHACLKLKLKTSPTKVRLASLKKISKRAGRRHERFDVAVAESADFASFDLRNRTSPDGHSNTYRTDFHLVGSMPKSDDVRRRQIPKKTCQKSKKNSAITSRRNQRVKIDKFRCHSRGACAAEIPSVVHAQWFSVAPFCTRRKMTKIPCFWCLVIGAQFQHFLEFFLPIFLLCS